MDFHRPQKLTQRNATRITQVGQVKGSDTRTVTVPPDGTVCPLLMLVKARERPLVKAVFSFIERRCIAASLRHIMGREGKQG